MTPEPCPSDDLLRLYAAGGVGAAVLDAVSAHLSGCGDCVARLDRVAVVLDALGVGLRQVGRAVATAPPPLQPGAELREYRLVEKLGEGGMGTVFKAVHTRLGKAVAVKVIRGSRRSNPDAVARFEREMQAVGRLDHPNIVRATDAGEADGIQYLVMEYVEGVDLADLAESRGPLPAAEACRLVRGAAVGLAHAHRHGLVHRDVKPSNLMLAADGTVKVLDLGLALLPTDIPLDPTLAAAATGSGGSTLTQTGHVVGTQHYVAPEQLRDSHSVDARADVYGLGATLWYLLTLEPPPAALPEGGPFPGGVPHDVWQKLLAADPRERFASAEAVAAVMRRYEAGEPRRRWGGWAMAGLTAAAVSGVVLFWPRPEPTGSPTGEAVREVAPPPRVALPIGKLPFTRDEALRLRDTYAAELRVPPLAEDRDGVKFTLIPPGEFGMTDECRVRLTRPYYLGVTEVTVGEFREFVTASGHKTTPETDGLGGHYLDWAAPAGKKFQRGPQFNWRTPGYATVTDRHPVTQVSYKDAAAYCAWRSKKYGATYRLPTEAEWVWAGRGGSLGQVPTPLDPNAEPSEWYRATVGKPPQPQPVGRLAANVWGLHDFHGNVCEICADRFADLPPGLHTDYARREGTEHLFPVLRGSSFFHVAIDFNDRGYLKEYDHFVGFRVVREVPSPK